MDIDTINLTLPFDQVEQPQNNREDIDLRKEAHQFFRKYSRELLVLAGVCDCGVSIVLNPLVGGFAASLAALKETHRVKKMPTNTFAKERLGEITANEKAGFIFFSAHTVLAMTIHTSLQKWPVFQVAAAAPSAALWGWAVGNRIAKIMLQRPEQEGCPV